MTQQGVRTRETGGAARGPGGPGDAYETRHLELLKEAAALIARGGFHKTSIRDLARATGRSLSGLYYYFTSKEELLFQIQYHCYTTLLAAARRVVRRDATPHDRLVAFISHHISYFRHNMDEMKVLAHEDLTLGGPRGRRILELKRAYSRLLIDLVTDYQAGMRRRPPRTPPDLAAFILFGMMNWMYTWPRQLRSRPAEELAAAVAEIFVCGFPGCPAASRNQMRKSIICPAGVFWPGAMAGETGAGE
ncbi:MAG: TetR/AcrR family transcriptional regulator [Acidobacteriota bacterium]